jgi:hypothetical protein
MQQVPVPRPGFVQIEGEALHSTHAVSWVDWKLGRAKETIASGREWNLQLSSGASMQLPDPEALTQAMQELTKTDWTFFITDRRLLWHFGSASVAKGPPAAVALASVTKVERETDAAFKVYAAGQDMSFMTAMGEVDQVLAALKAARRSPRPVGETARYFTFRDTPARAPWICGACGWLTAEGDACWCCARTVSGDPGVICEECRTVLASRQDLCPNESAHRRKGLRGLFRRRD